MKHPCDLPMTKSFNLSLPVTLVPARTVIRTLLRLRPCARTSGRSRRCIGKQSEQFHPRRARLLGRTLPETVSSTVERKKRSATLSKRIHPAAAAREFKRVAISSASNAGPSTGGSLPGLPVQLYASFFVRVRSRRRGTFPTSGRRLSRFPRGCLRRWRTPSQSRSSRAYRNLLPVPSFRVESTGTSVWTSR